MFRNHKCTIKRPYKEKINGEIVYLEPETIAVDVPCHLSIKANSALNQSQSTATVLYDYVLFTDNNVVIKPNDIIECNGHFLRAGESVRYPLTTQTTCEVDKIV